ncbi:MAG: formyltetrahydrofolate deformylase [Bacteroidales bacterium]|nr:formyltetrahydrofolate deformylase [Bacteroidales bacterium]
MDTPNTSDKPAQAGEKTAVLLMHCPDRPGIIAILTEFINANGGNILYLDQYVDRVNSIFYMRVQWDLEGFAIPADKIREYFDTLYAQRFEVSYNLYFTGTPQRMAIFVSKMSHCIYDLLARYRAGEWAGWNVEIPVIVSNHPDLKYIADQFGIPFEHIPVTRENKPEAEAQQFAVLERYGIDFIVLARYMQVLSDEFTRRYPNRVINIHHSFLPAFIGSKPYHAAHQRGVKLIGATSHYVTADLDAGPIIEQDIVRITHKDTVDDLVKKGRDLEKIVLARAVEKHLQHKILPYGNKTVVFN